LVGGIELRFIATGLGHSALEVIEVMCPTSLCGLGEAS